MEIGVRNIKHFSLPRLASREESPPSPPAADSVNLSQAAKALEGKGGPSVPIEQDLGLDLRTDFKVSIGGPKGIVNIPPGPTPFVSPSGTLFLGDPRQLVSVGSDCEVKWRADLPDGLRFTQGATPVLTEGAQPRAWFVCESVAPKPADPFATPQPPSERGLVAFDPETGELLHRLTFSCDRLELSGSDGDGNLLLVSHHGDKQIAAKALAQISPSGEVEALLEFSDHVDAPVPRSSPFAPRMDTHKGPIADGEGNLYISGNRSVARWNRASGEVDWTYELPDGDWEIHGLEGVAGGPGQRTLYLSDVTGTHPLFERTVRVIDAESGEEKKRIELTSNWEPRCLVEDDGTLLVGDGSRLLRIDTEGRTVEMTQPVELNWGTNALKLAQGPGTEIAAARRFDRSVILFGEETREFTFPGAVREIYVSGDALLVHSVGGGKAHHLSQLVEGQSGQAGLLTGKQGWMRSFVGDDLMVIPAGDGGAFVVSPYESKATSLATDGRSLTDSDQAGGPGEAPDPKIVRVGQTVFVGSIPLRIRRIG